MHHVERMRLFAKLFGLIFMEFKLLTDVRHQFYKTCLDEHVLSYQRAPIGALRSLPAAGWLSDDL